MAGWPPVNELKGWQIFSVLAWGILPEPLQASPGNVSKSLFENEVLPLLLVVVLVLLLGLVRDFEDEEDPVMASFSDTL